MNIIPRTRQAFSLVEVVLALGVVAFCMVAIFGLLPVGVNSNQMSMEQTAAANLASAVVADLQSIPKGVSATVQTSPRYKVPAPQSALTNGGTTTSTAFFLREDGTATDVPGTDAKASDNPRYRVTITYVIPASTQPYFAVPTRVQITWPAMADQKVANPPTHYVGAFEVNASLNRN